MRFLVQRVTEASVTVDNIVTGKIGKGFLVLIGITHFDTKDDADFLINKLLNFGYSYGVFFFGNGINNCVDVLIKVVFNQFGCARF